jgi:predicted HicB family RNase H-like nuclease
MKYYIKMDASKPNTRRYLNDKLNLRLSKDHKKELQRLAKENKISISELIRNILNQNK